MTGLNQVLQQSLAEYLRLFGIQGATLILDSRVASRIGRTSLKKVPLIGFGTLIKQQPQAYPTLWKMLVFHSFDFEGQT